MQLSIFLLSPSPRNSLFLHSLQNENEGQRFRQPSFYDEARCPSPWGVAHPRACFRSPVVDRKKNCGAWTEHLRLMSFVVETKLTSQRQAGRCSEYNGKIAVVGG